MKKVIICALAVVAFTACKKGTTVEPQLPAGESAEINFTTSADVTKGQAVDYTANSKSFFLGDQIGVYMANADAQLTVPYTFKPRKAVPVITEANEAVNYGYTYATPFWAAIDATTSKLLYPKKAAVPNKAQLYAYFPYTGTAGSTLAKVSANDNTSVLNFTYKADQTADADLRVLDVMWAKNTGATGFEGWSEQTAALPLEFSHLMTKLNFTIRLKHSNGTEVRYLRAIEVKGKEINTQNAELDVVAGTLTPKTIQTTPGSVFYFNGGNTEATLFKGTAAADPSQGAGKASSIMTLPAAAPAPARTFNDLLIYPFTQTASTNSFVFYLSKDLTKTYADMPALYEAVKDGSVEVFTAPILAAQSGALYDFKAGVNNVMNVTIDIENPAINITATIKPWADTTPQDIPAQ